MTQQRFTTRMTRKTIICCMPMLPFMRHLTCEMKIKEAYELKYFYQNILDYLNIIWISLNIGLPTLIYANSLPTGITIFSKHAIKAS